VDGMCAVSELRAEIAEAQRLVSMAEAYEEKKKETGKAKETARAQAQDGFILLWEYSLQRESGGQLYSMTAQVRKYRRDNPHGEYQVWYDNERGNSLSEDDVKKLYPGISIEKMSQVVEGEEKAYKVIRAYAVLGRHGTDTYQIRKYDDSDPHGKYQEWTNKRFTKTLTEEEAMEKSPAHAAWTMSEEECKKAGLQARLGELKLLCTHAGDRVCGDGYRKPI